MNKIILFSSILTLTLLLSFSIDSASAHPHSGKVMIEDHTHEPETEIVSLGGSIALEKTTIFMHIHEENSLPWAYVEGHISNPVEGYPVIIKIFKNNDAVHLAQTNVGKNGEYEYKFRVLNSDNSNTDKIFDGKYTVKIFKVVYLDQENLV